MAMGVYHVGEEGRKLHADPIAGATIRKGFAQRVVRNGPQRMCRGTCGNQSLCNTFVCSPEPPIPPPYSYGMKPKRRFSAVLAVFLHPFAAACLLLLMLPALASGASTDYDRWYRLELQGKHAGWMHTTQTTGVDGITTSIIQHMKIKRGDEAIVVESESRFLESAAGKPVSLSTKQTIGAEPIVTTYRYVDNGIHVTTPARGGKPARSSDLPRPYGVWLTPAAGTTFLKQRLGADAREITLRTVDPSLGPIPTTFTYKIIEKTQAEAMGKQVPAYTAHVSSDRIAGASSVQVIDELGAVISSEVAMGGLTLGVRLADEKTAKARFDPPELMESMVVRSDRAIKNASSTTQATYILTVADDKSKAPQAADAKDEPFPFPSAASQTVEKTGRNAYRLTVRIKQPQTAPDADVQDGQFVASSALIEAEDPDVMRLSREAVNGIGSRPPEVQAEAMRQYVHRHIARKDLDVGFGAAGEVARNKNGDCTEHAVLLAAMLRAGGIPSRVVSGLVYVESIGSVKHAFAYHMWTQALLELDGEMRWIDLDPTLGRSTPFDASHIALTTAALDEDRPQDALAGLLPLLGRISISVEQAE